MRCVVTGAAGFVGSSLVDRLLASGHEVLGIDCFIDYYPREAKERNLERARSFENFEFIDDDLLNLDLSKALEGCDYVYHQAAQAGVRVSWGSSFAIYTDNNILATQKLLEAARQPSVSANLKKVVYASSSSVYGDAESLPTTEDVRPQPLSPYGVSKLAAEQLMVLYTKEFNVPTASLRYFTVYGPRQRPDMAFHRFIRSALSGETISVYDDGSQSRDFTFIEDILDANIAAAESSSEELVFNVGGGSRVTINECLDTLRDIVGSSFSVDYGPRQSGDVKHTSADTSRAQTELTYQPKISLKEGLTAETRWLESLVEDTKPLSRRQQAG